MLAVSILYSYLKKKAVNYSSLHFQLLDFEYFTEVSKSTVGKGGRGVDLNLRQISVYPKSLKVQGIPMTLIRGVH